MSHSYDIYVFSILQSLGVERNLIFSEYKFLSERRFRFDYAIPRYQLGIEIDGGVFCGGRHTRGLGFIKDQEKTNLACCEGWYVLRFIPKDLNSGNFLEIVEKFIKNYKEKKNEVF